MKVLIASGGTGGHLFPALALGQEFQSREHQVLFVGSGRPLDRQVEAKTDLPWRHLKSGRVKGMGLFNKIAAFLILPLSCLQALYFLICEKPHLVIGVGGSSTGPMVLMAGLVAIKTAILENNRIPGLTNRILARIVDRIFIAMPIAPYFKTMKRKLRLTGNPMRRSVVEQFERGAKNVDDFTLLILGGSQGAHALNRLMKDLIPHLQAMPAPFRIIHVTGPADHEWISQAYREAKLNATVLPFTDELGLYYKQADLVLSRAGASTIADLIYFGRASVLVPYPHAADGHQEANARYLAEAGAAFLQPQDELDAAEFANRLREWKENRKPLQEMGRRVQTLAPKSPALEIVRECEALVNGHV